MKSKLNSSIVLITGASNGIGKETALLLATSKHSLILTYHREKEAGEAVARECLRRGAPHVELHALDLTQDSSIHALAKKVKHVDWLINNAGVFVNKPLDKHSNDEIERVLRTNLEGTIKLTHALIPIVKKGIVNVASGAGKEAYERMIVYCASKFGLRGFTQGLATEFPKLNIVCVNPGYTATRMTNYYGISPVKVGEVIVGVMDETYTPSQNGGDVDVWDIMGGD